MKSRNVAYIPAIDHLRLLAALLVFSFHFFHYYYGNWQALPQYALFGLVTEGHTGVSLFFVLSGFIFMIIAGNGEIDYRLFLRNRILRIAPLFLTVFVVAISIGRDRFEPMDLLYVFATNLGDAPTSWHFITGPAWSISVEFTFYLVFPFLALFARRQGAAYLVKLIGLLLLIKIGAYFAADNAKHMLYSTLVGRFDQFLIGMLAGLAYERHGEKFLKWGRALLAAAAIAIVLAIAAQASWFSFLSEDQKQPMWIVWGSLEAGLWALVALGYLSARLPWPAALDHALSRGGTWSFSFYMWHTLLIFAAFSLFGPVGGTGIVPLALNMIALLVATLGVAWLSYTTIELPFLQMRVRYTEPETMSERSG